jgi:hypothetical protein
MAASAKGNNLRLCNGRPVGYRFKQTRTIAAVGASRNLTSPHDRRRRLTPLTAKSANMKRFDHLLSLCAIAVLAACSPSHPADQARSFEDLAARSVSQEIGPDFKSIKEISISASKTVACGTIDTRSSGNVFAIVLDRPFPTQTRVVVKTPPNSPRNPTSDERRQWGKATLRAMREITVLCQDAGAPLPFHKVR